MASETIVYTPENNGGSVPAWLAMNNGFGGMNNVLPWMCAMGGGMGGFGGFGGAGIGAGLVGFLLGTFLNNGNGLLGGGNNRGEEFLSNQINNAAGRELIMQAVNGTDANVRALANTVNCDFNSMRDGICAIRAGIDQVAAQTGMSALQVQNAILSGNAGIISQINQCCCEAKQLIAQQGYENQIATLNQTNQLAGAISGSSQRIVDAISGLETRMNKEFCDARERDMQAQINTQADIITQLRNAASNAAQTATFQNAFTVLNEKITKLAERQPNTVPVQWPNLTAVSNTPNATTGFFGAGAWGNGVSFGNGVLF